MFPKFFFIPILSSLILTHSNSQCLDDQKNFLLKLKNELIFNSSLSMKLVQWNQTDECCKWYGVECDAAGNIVSLQLNDESISGGLGDSSSLFKLEYLEKLNLAYNDFNFTKIPRGSAEILSLRRLVSLDISDNWALKQLSLEYPNLEMLVQNLSGLRELYLDAVNITASDERRKWSLIISSYLPNLTSLSMSYCDLSGPLSNSFLQLHSLSTLRLDLNDLSAVVPADLFASFPSLTILSLVACQLKGSIPSTFANLTKLVRVDLSNNLLSGSLSSFLFEGLSSLVYLSLRLNSFSGGVPDSVFQLHSLKTLWLSSNLFNGTCQLNKFQSLPNLTTLGLGSNNLFVDVKTKGSSTYRLPQLKVLDLGSCNLYDFPDFIKHSNIRRLDLSDNHIAGEIPSWIWGAQLQHLDISYNLLTNLEKPYHFPASLGYINLHSNQLKGELHLPIPPNTENRTSNLWCLILANNSFSGSIPTSLCNALGFLLLDLSVNQFSDNIPPCLLENITALSLGQNNISGHIPDNFSLNCGLQYFDLSYNSLEGKVPESLKSCTSLEFMNVGNNNINDNFPCMLSSSLRVLVLHSNRFYGEVRCHNCWESLQVLDISSNNFSGSLESTNFSRWRAMVLGSDEQLRNKDSGYYAFLIYGVTVTLKGTGTNLDKIWPDFGTIDFSCNNFEGEIPNAIGDLSLLHHLDFSGNSLNGSIPNSFGRLSNLESLDLSRNQLTERIPVELGGLTFLSFLNLSYNKLVGEIPRGRQFQTFSADSFEGNLGLCSFPLNISCSPTTDDVSGLSPRGDDDDEDEREIEWEYVSAALGFVVGLGSIVWLLLFCRSFKEKYFGKVDEIIEEIFDGRNKRRRRAREEVRN